jgi:hypothetical protein
VALPEEHETIGLGERQRAQDHRVGDAEDGRGASKAEAQGEHRHEREGRPPAEPPGGVYPVPKEAVHVFFHYRSGGRVFFPAPVKCPGRDPHVGTYRESWPRPFTDPFSSRGGDPMSKTLRRMPLLCVAVVAALSAPAIARAQEPQEPETPETCTVMEYVPLEPCRLYDTRLTGNPIVTDEIVPNGSRGFRKFKLVSSACGIPSDAQAVAINYTVPGLGLEFLGHVTLSTASDRTQTPVASWINMTPGAIGIANAGAVKVKNGEVSATLFLADGPGPSIGSLAHAVIDVNGYFAKSRCCRY